MKNIFHEFLNPHCEHCKEAREDSKVCASCEVLKLEIERLRIENTRLLDRILEKPKEEVRISTEDLKPIMPRNISWNVRKQMLENESRAQAKIINEQVITTKDLEAEIGIKTDAI